MLGFDRHAARATWTAVLVVLLLYFIYLIRSTLFIFTLALLFAYLLTPLVNLLDRVLPVSRTRAPALALSYIIFVGAVVSFGISVGSRVVDQANRLSQDLPPKVTAWMQTPAASSTINEIKDKALERLSTDVGQYSTELLSSLPKAGAKFLSVASSLIFVVIIPILAFFFLKDGHLIKEHAVEMVAEGPRRDLLNDVLADIDQLLAHYMRALFLLSVAAFTAYAIFFAIMGVPYAILLAAVAGIMEFIPMIGPLGAAIIILTIAAVANAHVLWVLIFILAYRMVQDYVISPHLMGHGVELHPLLVLFGVFAGAEIAGVGGTLLSVPVIALIRIIYRRIRKSRIDSRLAMPAA
jgi:predicted PurR-regulated permease PerM